MDSDRETRNQTCIHALIKSTVYASKDEVQNFFDTTSAENSLV